MDIMYILNSLSNERPLFHSEADFQHALAWKIQQCYPQSEIRLETKLYGRSTRIYLDLLIIHQGKKYAIELKYKTRSLDIEIRNEKFHLNHQGAQDIGRYDVVKDVERLERMVEEKLVDEGLLIFLTNDHSYYIKPHNEIQTIDKEFRLHEGQQLMGTLNWSDNAGEGTKRGREQSIKLNGKYNVKWNDLSEVSNNHTGQFRFLFLSIKSQQSEKNFTPKTFIEQSKDSVENVDKKQLNTPKWFQSFVEKKQLPQSQRDLTEKLKHHLESTGYSVKTKYPIRNEKIDIVAKRNSEVLLIELRFKTSLVQTVYQNKHIHLKKQGAHDVARYDFIKDMQKLEKVTSRLSEHKGYAIMITNDQAYWNPGKKMNPVDKAFHIHKGSEITGLRSWGEEASKGTRKNREAELFLKQSYRPSWRPYLSLDVEKNGEFQVLLVEF